MTATGGKAEKQLNGLGKGSQGLAAGLNNVEKAARSVETTTSRVLRAAAAAGVGLGFGAVITKVARETINAQNEQRQLAAVIRSTGAAAGYSVDQLNEMAEALSNASTFSAGDINRAQTRLLSYTGIVGEVFPRAMQSVIDTSVRMGMSVEQAAETVGRALDIPSQGLTSLSRQGFRFTDSQKALVERLEQVGKVGEAQNIVLQALESSYGGAAFAARNTFGGALAGLQNQIDDLLTGDDDSVYGLTSSINAFTNTLASSETKSAFASFTQNLVDLANSFTTTAAVINGSSFLGWGSLSGDQIDDPAMAIGDIERKISNLERMRSDLDPDKSFVNKLNDFMYGDVGDIDRQLAYLETQKKALMGYLRLADNPILKMYPEGMFGEPSGQGSSPAAGGSGGGAGSKPKKNPDHLGDFMQSMNIDYAMQEYQDYLDFIEDITGRADERILQQQQNWLDNARKTGLITVNEYGDAIDELVERTSKGG
ncbi:MAG TPA: hypothetical protein DIS96_03760, partial [Pusillimonas sp.]|nr:hypothetical protein [Pusillimonas sp.]